MWCRTRLLPYGRFKPPKTSVSVTIRVNSLKALEAFRENPHSVDLVITDMTMPNMTGDRLPQELRRIRSDITIIVCTGFSERMSEEKAKSMGIKGFL
jgi:YesN/AraC family two-component response regulator